MMLATHLGDHHKKRSGFTLIEISIVLVIIGLIVGAILVGRDLIRASELRKLITEVDEFKSAANTFRLKYGQLPGDMHISVAAQLGFFAFTGVNAGITIGNNNGLIESSNIEGMCNGEGSVIFHHLSQANLIKFSITTALQPDASTFYVGTPAAETEVTPFTLQNYLPESKIGGAYFCANKSDTSNILRFIAATQRSKSNVFTLRGNSDAATMSFMNPSISPIDLYSIDKKTNDGSPVSGKILVSTSDLFSGGTPYWAAAASAGICSFGGGGATSATQTYNAASSTGGNTRSCQPVFVW